MSDPAPKPGSPMDPSQGEIPPEREDTLEENTLIIEDEVLRKGFTSVPNYLFEDVTLSIPARFTYICLLRYAWQAGSCFPGQVRLARDLGVSDRMVRKYLQELVDHRYIRVIRRGLGMTNLYVILKLQLSTSQTAPNPVPAPVNPSSTADRKSGSDQDRNHASDTDRNRELTADRNWTSDQERNLSSEPERNVVSTANRNGSSGKKDSGEKDSARKNLEEKQIPSKDSKIRRTHIQQATVAIQGSDFSGQPPVSARQQALFVEQQATIRSEGKRQVAESNSSPPLPEQQASSGASAAAFRAEPAPTTGQAARLPRPIGADPTHSAGARSAGAGARGQNAPPIRHNETGYSSRDMPYSDLVACITEDFTRQVLHDSEHLQSNVTQSINLWRASGLSEDDFIDLLYEAKDIALKRTATIQKTVGSQGLKNRAPYFFRVLKDLLSRQGLVGEG